MKPILDMSLKITNLRLQLHLPGANELTLSKKVTAASPRGQRVNLVLVLTLVAALLSDSHQPAAVHGSLDGCRLSQRLTVNAQYPHLYSTRP